MYPRKRSTIGWPITISVSLIVLNTVLMVCWIVLLARLSGWTALTVGVVAFTLILVGISFWLVITIKEIRLNHRQANFVDSVTHELKSPIAALQLYLETLRMRSIDEAKRAEFHAIMEAELHRLDRLINQLLEVGRLDALGENEVPEEIDLAQLVQRCAHTACLNHGHDVADVFRIQVPPVQILGSRIVLELIFSNLIDNAVKYGADQPEVEVTAVPHGSNRAKFFFSNNGTGISSQERRKVFQIFYRGGSELERRRKGTGVGLYIVQTLVKRLNGRVTVRDRPDGLPGCVFDLDLPRCTWPRVIPPSSK